MRKGVVALITFFGGAYFLLEFLLPAQIGPFDNPLSPYQPLATNLVIVLGTMAFLLGPINLVRGNLGTIWHRRKGWIGSLVFLGGLVIGIVLTAAKDVALARQAERPGPDLAQTAPPPTTPPPQTELEEPIDVVTTQEAEAEQEPGLGTVTADEPPPSRSLAERLYQVMLSGLILAFGGSSMALLTFYLVSAAFRAFRMQTLDAGVMMITALIVLVGLAPLGDMLFAVLPSQAQPNTWAVWVLRVPNTAVQRTIAIGLCAGAFAVGVRHWLSVGTRSE